MIMIGLLFFQAILICVQLWLLWMSDGKNPRVYAGIFVTTMMFVVSALVIAK